MRSWHAAIGVRLIWRARPALARRRSVIYIPARASLGQKWRWRLPKVCNLPPEYVFRQAGLLPPRTEVEEDLSFQQILAIMQDMTEEERKEIVDYALFRLRRGQEDS